MGGMEKAFFESLRCDELEAIEEILLRRYNDIQYILNMNILDFFIFYEKATESIAEERIYKQWLVQLPHMTKDTYKPYSEYYESQTMKNVDKRSADEIIAEIEDIHGKEIE